MPFFLRQAKWANWQGRSLLDDEARARARDDFALSPRDTDGLSVFEVSTHAELQVVIAAIAAKRMRLDNVDLLEIADAELRSFGEVTLTPGELPVPRANALHRSLAWEQPALHALADRLLDLRCEAKRHRKDVVRAAVAALAIEEVEQGPHREWMATLLAR